MSTDGSNPAGAASSVMNVRPSSGRAPSSGNSSGVTASACTRSGRSPPVRFTFRLANAPTAEKTPLPRSASRSAHTSSPSGISASAFPPSTTISVAGSSYGRLRSRKPSTMLKAAALMPIPTPRHASTATVNTGLRPKLRTA